VSDDLLCVTDIIATILDLAGISIPEYMTGKSILDPKFQRDFIFSARDMWDEVMEKSRSISTKQDKYIRNDMTNVPWDAGQAYLEFYRPAVHIMRGLNEKGELSENQARFIGKLKPREELGISRMPLLNFKKKETRASYNGNNLTKSGKSSIKPTTCIVQNLFKVIFRTQKLHLIIAY
jgi:hypothetical protein